MTTDAPYVEAMLDEIERTAGDEQSVAHTLAKGLASNMSKLIEAMAKGGPAPDEDEDEDEDEELDDEEPGDEDEDPDDDAPGYTDMQMGVTGNDGRLDVTNWLFRVGTKIEQLETAGSEITELRKAVAAQDAQIAELRTMLSEALAAQMGVIAPLSKGVIDLTERLSEIPEQVVTPRRRPAARPRSTPVANQVPQGDGSYIGGTARGQKVRLAKALQGGIIDSSMRRRFHLQGQFVDDAEANTQIRAQIEAL